MSDVGGFEGKILCEVPQSCAPCDSRDTCDTPATGYTPPEGWRVLAVGELLQNGDQFIPESGAVEVLWDVKTELAQPNGHYIRQIEPQPEPVPQPEPIQVREGRWRTRNGNIRNVTPTPAGDGREHRFPWWDAQYRQTWGEDGRYHVRGESPLDLVKCLGPIEPQSEPQPEPEPQPEHLQAIIAAQAETIARLQSEAHELNMEIGGLQRNLWERQSRIRNLETMHAAATQAVVDAGKVNDKLRAQADDFRSEIHYVQKELGEARAELAGAIQSRDALQARICVSEIRRNETLREQLDAATAELQKRHPDHVGRAISTEEWMDQFARDASVSRLQADRNDLAGKVVTLREQLQQANDRLAFLEALQPIAAACHTAQTMVRDMLGHMRCLLALHHTTDRRDFCTLLESILEVFDEAECDEDEDEDTDTTDTSDASEAGQG